jgi:glycosyltransferase involved in cell wall biosynthesis
VGIDLQKSANVATMMNSSHSERWLIISHEASNSGAPRMLLEVLRGVRAAKGPGWSCEILFRRSGVLTDEFARFGQVHQLSHTWANGSGFWAKVWRALVDRPWIQPRVLHRLVERWGKNNFDLVYNNTATNGFVVPAMRALGCPILTHVHESAYSLRRFNTSISLQQTLENSDHFLAVSPSVAADLDECGVSAERITVTPNFLPVLPDECAGDMQLALRARLGLPAEASIVTGCGHIDRLKGTDLFVEMAGILARKIRGEVLFNWVGGETDPWFARKVRRLVRRRGLGNRLRFIGAVNNAAPWFAASDLVAVTSRVESFPLVALEAAGVGRPVIGFAGARGLDSLLANESILLVRNFNVSLMASTIEGLLLNRPYARALGLRLRSKVAAEFLAEARVAEILTVANKLQLNRKS